MSLTNLAPFTLLLPALLITAVACTGTEPSDSTDSQADDTTSGDTTNTGDGDGDTGEPLGPTWHQDIAPMVAERCAGCHREGGIAPFSLQTYEDGAAWAVLAIEAMESKQMPPWGQDNTDDCQPRMGFLDDPRPTEAELSLFNEWIDAGTLEGDPDNAAPLPPAPELSLVNPDHELPIPAAVEIAPGSDQFWCLVMDPALDEDIFVNGAQIIPGNDLIVHHALVYVDANSDSDNLVDADGRYPCFGGPDIDGALIAVWAPGVPPQQTPDDVAFLIPAGSKLVMQVHYHPTGVTEIDGATTLQLREATQIPDYIAEYALPGNEGSQDNAGYGLQPGPGDSGPEPEFRIPAGAEAHTERQLFPVPPLVSNGELIEELIIWQASSHMHYVGVDMRLGVNRVQPEAGSGIDEECFVQTPYYSFEWQRGYRYDGPLSDMPTIRAGDVLTLDCLYNNSMSNPYVVEALADQGLDAPVDVYLGEETLDEMCLGVFGIATPYAP